MDLMQIIIEYIMKARYEDLSIQTVEAIKKLFLDTLGTTIAGSSAEGSEALVDLLKDWGGKEESTIWVYGGRVPAPNAAFVNCTMARALDLDDVHEAGGGHLSASFVPASLVLAEYIKKPIHGRDLILAFAVGSDLSCRLRCALTAFPGWVAQTFSPFGIVAMGGKLLGFSKDQFINGMGIAYSQCSTNLQANIDGALTVRLQQGMGAKAGILATVLTERGFTGAKDVFQGIYGFYPLYAQNKYDPAVITDQLGNRFEIINASIKPYPSCKHTHIPISATMEIVKEHNIEPQQIDKIEVYTNSKAYSITGSGDNKYHPRNVIDAQFSIPFTVATAAVKRKIFIDDFTEDGIRNSEVLQLAQKVKVQVDPKIDKTPGVVAPARVELETKGGKHYSKYMEIIKGHPKNPMNWRDCVEKFHECLRFSAKPLNQNKVAELVRLVGNLEEMDDARSLVESLVV